MSLTAERTIPCRLCGRPTPMLGTKLCNPCWETDRAVTSNPDLARRILAGLAPPMTTPTNEEVRRQFEAEFSRSPFDLPTARWGADAGWPGQYKNYPTQLAFDAYQAALSSPAVVALVEADREYDAAAEHLATQRRQVGAIDQAAERFNRAKARRTAALAPFTTGAGHE